MEEVVDVKLKLREHISAQMLSVQRKVNEFKSIKDNLEKTYKGFFEDIKKHSSNFELSLIPRSEHFDVKAYGVDSNGNLNYSKWNVVDTIIVNYHDCSINYIGKLPPNVNQYSKPKVYVEEHITYNKRGYRSTNHGFKMQVEIGYDKDKKFYKTGKKIVDIVESYIENKFQQHESSLKHEEIKKLAYKQLSETYKYCIKKTDGDSFIVKNLNNTEVTLSYHQNALNEIVFVVKNIKVNSEHNVKNLIESLGKL